MEDYLQEFEVGGDPIALPPKEIRQFAAVYLDWEVRDGDGIHKCGEPVIKMPLIFSADVNDAIIWELRDMADEYNEQWQPTHYWEKMARVFVGAFPTPYRETIQSSMTRLGEYK